MACVSGGDTAQSASGEEQLNVKLKEAYGVGLESVKAPPPGPPPPRPRAPL